MAKVGNLTFLLIFLTIILFSKTVLGQQSNYIYQQYTVIDGLPSNECYSIIQDSRGFIWISTDNGVVRFDGYAFKEYGIEEGLGDLVIFIMKEDNDGRIWMGGLLQKMYIYDPLCDRFELYTYQNQLDKFYDKRNFYKEFHVLNDTLWIVGEKMIKIGPNGDVFFNKNESNESIKLYKSSEYVLTSRFRPNFKKLEEFLKNPHIVLMNSDISYNLPLKIQYSEKILSTPSTVTFIKDNILFAVGNNFGLINTDNQMIYQNKEEGIIYLSQNKKGHAVMGMRNGKGIRMYSDLKNNRYETLIWDVEGSGFLEDKDGSYWITTLDKGLFHIKSPYIKYVSADFKTDYYAHIDADSLGHLYIASFNGSVHKISLENIDIIKSIKKPSGSDIKLFKIIDNDLWIHSRLFMFVISSKDNKIYPVKNPYNKFNNNYIEVNDIIKLDNSFIGARDKKNLLIIEKTNNQFVLNKYLKLNSSLEEKNYSIIRDGQYIYSGTSHGLYEFNLHTQRSQKINKIPNVRIEKIIQDTDGHKYLATKGLGIIVWPFNKNPYIINHNDGLLTNVLEDVSLGENQSIWVASIKGISHIIFDSLGNHSIKNYTMSHGLPIPDVYHTVWTRGKLYAATGKGVIELTPQPIDSLVVTPRFTSFLVNDAEVLSQKTYSFQHYENNIKLTFESVDFYQGKNIQFQYTINEGVPIKHNQRYINLTNLLPGAYTLNVSAINFDGIQSKPASISFVIKQPWYQTKWFFLVLLLSFIGTFFLIVKSRIKFLKKQNEITQEINQLEKAALQAQMNPHFIFNCLNSIQSFIIKNNKEQAMEYLGSFAHLIRQYLHYSTKQYISLSDEINLLTNYMDLEKLRFNNSFMYYIDVDKKVNIVDTKIPPMLIQPFVENAIIHGMKDKKNNEGQIKIIIRMEKPYLVVTIIDNGSGIQKSVHPNTKHKSMGMSITQRRIDHIHKSKSVDYKLQTESDSNGTKVSLKIPQVFN